MRVLVADGDRSNCLLLERSFRQWGYEPILAEDGETAWAVLSGSNPPRLAFVDKDMPKITGLEICRRLGLRGAATQVYVILMASDDSPNEIASRLANGANDFLAKPLQQEDLHSKLRTAERVLTQESSPLSLRRSALMGTLSAGIAHEFNNMLCGILGHLELTLDTPGLPRQAVERMEMIKGIAWRAAGVVEHLLLVSGHNLAGTRTYYPFNSVLRDALQKLADFAAREGIRIKAELGEMPEIPMDAGGLTRAFYNMMLNACQSMAGSATRQLSVSSSFDGKRILVSITDTGCGITSEDRERIFLPFFSTKGEHAKSHGAQAKIKGIGLGLTVAQAIIHAHGGEVSVVSEPGLGAVFTISIPVEAGS